MKIWLFRNSLVRGELEYTWQGCQCYTLETGNDSYRFKHRKKSIKES